MSETFISYARKDGLEFAERLERELPNTWRDKRDLNPFTDFTAEIEKAIQAARQVLVCVTPDVLREESFVRREIAYAIYLRKPILVARFKDVPPPLHVFNHTWLDFFRMSWEQAIAQVKAWLSDFVKPTPINTPASAPNDPYYDYLGRLYDEIVEYLDSTAIKLIDLRAANTSSAVQARPRLLSSFKARAGLNESERPIETLREGLLLFKQRALLMGEPGAGKTISMLAMARDAVALRMSNPQAPLPILMHCATWNSSPAPGQPLHNWIMEETQLPASALQGQTLLLLDGLDELGTERVEKVRGADGREVEQPYDPRLRFLEALPAEGAVVVSTRIEEYEAIGQKARLNGAVTLRPLTDEQISDYLSAYPALWEALQRDRELLDMLRTPLLLSYMAFAYKDDPGAVQLLAEKDRVEVSDAIFERYVQQRYAHEARRLAVGQAPPYTLDELYAALGRAAMANAIGAGLGKLEEDLRIEVEANIFQAGDFAPFVDNTDAFLAWVILLNLMNRGDVGLRFNHLRLRDFFGRGYALKHLNDNYAPMRYAAATALGRLGDGRSVEPLLARLSDSDSDVRFGVAGALGTLGDGRAVEPLLARLSDSNSNVRIAVAGALGTLGDGRAVEPLLACLGDDNQGVRVAAAWALDMLGWQAQTQEQQIDYLIANQAWDELAQIGISAVELLLARLGDDDGRVRSVAAYTLGRLGNARAVAPLLARLGDSDSDVRCAAAAALGQLGDGRAVEPLIARLGNKSEWVVRRAAIEALVKIGVPSVEPLLACLGDGDGWVRFAATEALGKLGDGRAVEPLARLLDDQEKPWLSRKTVGEVAQQALRAIGTPQALAALEAWRKRRGE